MQCNIQKRSSLKRSIQYYITQFRVNRKQILNTSKINQKRNLPNINTKVFSFITMRHNYHQLITTFRKDKRFKTFYDYWNVHLSLPGRRIHRRRWFEKTAQQNTLVFVIEEVTKNKHPHEISYLTRRRFHICLKISLQLLR